jgi:hypothetical protein
LEHFVEALDLTATLVDLGLALCRVRDYAELLRELLVVNVARRISSAQSGASAELLQEREERVRRSESPRRRTERRGACEGAFFDRLVGVDIHLGHLDVVFVPNVGTSWWRLPPPPGVRTHATTVSL